MTDLDLAAVRGRVTVADDAAFAERAHPHQLAVVQRPAAVIDATSVEDLREVLSAARAAGLTVATQAAGHGASEDLAGSVLVRLAAFDRVDLDEVAGTAVVGAGVTAGALLDRLAGTGLVPAIGTSPDVSIVPLVLGGGHGWVSRVVGLSAQTVRRVELLRPDGTHGWVDDDSEPDLMRVLRGAGGVVGIVTAVELELLRAPALTAGGAAFPLVDGATMWRAVRDAALPDSVNVFVGSMRMPDVPFLPPQIRGQSWFGVDALTPDGDLSALQEALAGGTATRTTFGPIDLPQIPEITNDPRAAGASLNASALLGELPDEAIEALLAWHRSDAGAPVVILGARLLGGALDREGRSAVAGTRGARWLLGAILPLPPGVPQDAARATLAELMELVRPWTVPGNVPTFLAQHQRLADALDADALALVHHVRAALGADVIRPVRL